MLKVDYEDLEPSEDYLVMEYEGMPFSGVAFEYGQNGEVITETNFVDGQKSGVSKEWSSSGILIREQSFLLDALHGPSREWYDNGKPKLDGVYELGVCVKEKEWDIQGNVTKDYAIDENGPQFLTLLKLRASNLGRMANGNSN